MRRDDIAREWHFDGKGHYLKDAAGRVIAEVWQCDTTWLWQGHLPPRDGRADLGIPCDARNSADAKRIVEGELAGTRSTQAEATLVSLRSAAPLRPLDRQTDPVDGLALFDHARSPAMP